MVNDSNVLREEVAVGNAELGAQFNLSMSTQVDEVERDRHCQMMFYEFMEAIARVASKISSFPNVKKEVLFIEKEESEDEEPVLMRNRGSSVDSSESELSEKDEKVKDNMTLYYNSLVKPLYIKIEIFIKYLQLCALEGIDLNKLMEE